MSEPSSISAGDRELIHRYLDEELSEEECRELEARFDGEPALEREYRAMARLRTALEAVGSGAVGDAQPIARRRPAARWLLAAAAVLAAIGGALWWQRTRPARPAAIAIAAVESQALLADLNASLGLSPSYLPPGNGPRGLPPAPDAPSPRDYLATAGQLFARRVQTALDAQPTEVDAAHYVVALRPDAACSAVVVSVDTIGRARLEFPPDVASGRLAAGAIRVLPRDVVTITPESEASQAVDFAYGFHVPGDPGIVAVDVLVGVRERELDDRELRELGVELQTYAGDRERSVARARQLLERAGFRIGELRVRAP